MEAVGVLPIFRNHRDPATRRILRKNRTT